jgi:hypothetical protein
LLFDDRHLLPPGVHEATLAEIETHFARFQRSGRRITLFGHLKAYLDAVMKTGWACSVIIDDSFVMPLVDEPNDIDLILVMPANWDMTADLRPFEYNVVSKAYTKREYKIEVYAVLPRSEQEQSYLELFQQVRIEWCRQFGWPADSKKGIVRILA